MTDFVQNETMSTNESQNKVFFLQYGDFEPVKVETHFNGELEREFPLVDVADVIRVAVADPATRELLGLPEKVGSLSLYILENGAERKLNSRDLLGSLDGANTLLIRPANQASPPVNLPVNQDPTVAAVVVPPVAADQKVPNVSISLESFNTCSQVD